MMSSKLVPKLRFKEFSGEWEEKKLKDITSAIFDGTHQTPKYTDKGIPFFSVENLISGKANKFISYSDYLIATNKNKPEKNDILLTRIGNIGFSKVVDWDYPFSIYVTLAVIKQDKRFNSYFLNYYFQSARYQKEILSKSLLSAVPCKINMDSLRKTKILLPPTPQEQQKIANTLSSLDNLIEANDKKLEALKEHKKGLMQQLFPTDDKKIPKLRFKEFSGEWEEKNLKSVSNITTGSSNREDSTKDKGEYTFFDRSEDIRTSHRYLFDDEAIIIAGEGQKFTPKYYKGKFDLHQRTYAILELQVIGKFLYYYIDKYKNYFLQNAVGSTVKSLRLPMFEKMPILLPTLPEQQKIANTLNSLDNLIETQTKKLEALKEHKKGLMQQMFVSEELEDE